MSIRTPVHPSTTSSLGPPTVDPASPAALLDTLRHEAPLVQCITNVVVSGFTANVLLALGAAPAMCDIPGESGVFARIASATLVNLGTPTTEQRSGAREAVDALVSGAGRWVLDPVAIGVLPVRTALAAELLEAKPSLIRGNASEILALAGLGAGGRGVDSTDSADDALDAAVAIARRTGGAVAVSGPVDLITDGHTIFRVSNGHEWLTRVTGGGCALGAVMAAFLAVAASDEAAEAAVAASVVYGIAAERAAAASTGPGSFAVSLLDALASITPADVERETRLERALATSSESADDAGSAA